MEDSAPLTSSVGQLLLVDDDNAFRQRLAVTLERRGFSVLSAASLAEARVIAAQSKPAYAVVDMRLDDGNGLDFIDELRALHPNVKAVPSRPGQSTIWPSRPTRMTSSRP
jgi:two-component system response regulator RegA